MPVGDQFQANTYTTNLQGYPAIGTVGSGEFVVVWRGAGSEYGSDTSNSSIQGQRYDAAGPVGPEFQINTYTTGYQVAPAVATHADGSFVVAWTSSVTMTARATTVRSTSSLGIPRATRTPATAASSG